MSLLMIAGRVAAFTGFTIPMRGNEVTVCERRMLTCLSRLRSP